MTTADVLPRAIRRVQDKLLVLLGANIELRSTLLQRMLHRDASEATSYWLQLVVAIGIATLGLVVGSTAVIIGAMLVAPLMTPILGLAMGLAAGAPFLTLRSIGRVAASVIAAVAGSALITWLLPFHELNAELVARTSPTVLDLVTAAFCALAGVYASLRPGSETVATAAGTSIGISLVPPLCACGYGIGSGNWHIAGGAGLLFLTNFVAIVVVGGIAFAGLGFGRVAISELESAELTRSEGAPVSSAIAKRLANTFSTRLGRALRLVMPLGFLAAVYVPLVKALDEIAWQVRVKGAVAKQLERTSMPIVQSRSRVDHHRVELSIVIVGTPADAEHLKASLNRNLEQEAGVAPHVDVFAVADASAISNIESSLAAPVAPPAPVPAPSVGDQVAASRAAIRDAVTAAWPLEAAGPLLAIDLETAAPHPEVRIRHLGPPLGASAIEMLGKALQRLLQQRVAVDDLPIPAEPLTRDRGDIAFVSDAAVALGRASDLERIHVCVARPRTSPRAKLAAADQELERAIDAVIAPAPRVTTAVGSQWLIHFVDGPCPAVDEGAVR